ncbi:MAG: transglycosylase domain-containing protein [Clostridia bacterium]|nr:transglycosylase domain-containing protein [Clostridia bacterium]
MENSNRKWYRHPALVITKQAFSALAKILLTVMLIGAITVCLVVSVLAIYVSTNFDGTENLPDLNQVSAESSSYIYVLDPATGEWKEDMKLQGANQIWTPLEEMPPYMKYAIIAIEDERYLDHNGVDWKRTVSAFANEVLKYLNLSDSTYGGSTITQQLIKILNEKNTPDQRRIEVKITEILQALEMERGTSYSKDDIIEAYLNIMPMSENIVGVGYAATAYFNKDLIDCSLAECALLASVTNNPSVYDPYENPEAARRRQRLVLAKMYECGFITEDEYKQALGEELVFRRRNNTSLIQDYYVDMVIEEVINDLMEKYGYSYSYAQTMVFYGGLNIYSAENKQEQATVEAVYKDDTKSPYPAKIEGDLEDPQTGLFVMDYDGRVVATIGARGEKTANRIQNFSTQTLRQPGSAIKPLSVFALATEYDLIHYSSMVRDCYLTMPDGSKWPTNYKKKPADNGDVLMTYAVQNSYNTVPARLLQVITPKKSFDFLTNSLGFENLYRTYVDADGTVFTDMDMAPLALGALTQGVTVREMCAAYQIFGNGGVYNDPWCYYSVTQGENVLLEKDSNSYQAISPQSAYIVNRLLQEVVFGAQGSGRDIRSSWTGWEFFAKTGTTSGTDNGDRDVYFCGGSPRYVAASWFGYAYNKNLRSAQKAARPLMNAAMVALHKGMDKMAFEVPEGIVEANYCVDTGLLATEDCKKTMVGVYKENFMPANCTLHGAVPPTNTNPSGGSTTGAGTTDSTSAGSTDATQSGTAANTSSTGSTASTSTSASTSSTSAQ